MRGVMTFEEAVCRTGAHCPTCRARGYGHSFRMALLRQWPGLGRIDFSCPDGKPWGRDRPAPAAVEGPFQKTCKAIAALPAEGVQSAFLQAMKAQIVDLIAKRPGGTCGQRAFYKRHLERKLQYYWDTYAPTN